MLQEFAKYETWNVSWTQGAQVDRCAHVHTPCRALLHILANNQLLLQRHLAIAADAWITTTVIATLHLLVKAAFRLFAFLFLASIRFDFSFNLLLNRSRLLILIILD